MTFESERPSRTTQKQRAPACDGQKRAPHASRRRRAAPFSASFVGESYSASARAFLATSASCAKVSASS